MARTKGRSTRGKRRASQASTEHIDQPFWGTSEVLDLMIWTATDPCPLCAAMGVVLPPSGAARDTVRAVVERALPDTV